MRKCIVASGVLVEGGRVLMIWHRKLGVWLYPGGHVEPNETPREAVVREFKEETGLDVEVVGPVYNLGSGEVSDEPMPMAILLETVRYPQETHLHYDLIFRVRRVGGELREGTWMTPEEVERSRTYENVKRIVRLAVALDSVTSGSGTSLSR
ncbi:NUDIX hydrolase [Acidilobus sp.]|uniref:NUDIX hydrolase n=1 Tax=Acidilobus sp. TaxID=1872109 RepID=UPI003D067A26